jgi:fructokinase
LADLQTWNVKTSLISQRLDGSTPIIIQRFKKDKFGNSIHKFYFKNPDNNEWLPSYKPVLASEVDSLIMISPVPSVFYFDRISKSTLDLAKYYKEAGALIFFEPSKIEISNQFDVCLSLADIVKFSEARINNYHLLYPNQRVPLEIITAGKEGVRFRFDHKLKAQNWNILKSYSISNILDSAGSGDWFSAGLITKLGTLGAKGFKNTSLEAVYNAISYGQALGALNCFFYGSRGLMYILKQAEVENYINLIQRGVTPVKFPDQSDIFLPIEDFSISSLYE